MSQSKQNTKFWVQDKTTNNVKNNIINILLYSFSLATALGFNNLILTVFDSLDTSTNILAKTTYVIIMFAVTITLAYYLNFTINK